MADEPNTDTPDQSDETTDPAPDEKSDKPETGTPDPSDAIKAALSKANREAKALRLKVKEYEDASKSDSDKLTERATAAESRAEKAERTLLQLTVGAEKGLTPAQSRRLVGETQEELETDADDLLASFQPNTDTPAGGARRKPQEKLGGGLDPDEEPDETDPAKLAAMVPRRY